MELGTDWKDSRIDDMKNELFIMEKVKHLYIVKVCIKSLSVLH